MFAGMTSPVRIAVMLAHEEATRMGAGLIGTGHLLLGLLRVDEGVAAEILRSLIVELEDMRKRVESGADERP
jgi:ATP-dependent Clp protease ATP-binding subunit ClpC